MESNNVDLRMVFSALPGNSLLLLPDSPKFSIVGVTKGFAEMTGRNTESLLNKGLFEAFPTDPSNSDANSEKEVRASLNYTVENKCAHQLKSQRHIVGSLFGEDEKHYWISDNQPVVDEKGTLRYIIHTAADMTARVLADQRDSRLHGIEKAYNLFMSAPVIVGILRGDDYVIELANEGLLTVWGRNTDVIGKPLINAIPELGEQGFIALLDNVRNTGKPFYAYDFPIQLYRDNKEELLYFDFVYKAFYDDQSSPRASGVISVGHDVTERVVARKKIHEAEAKYQSLFNSLDQGFCVMKVIFDSQNKPVDYLFLETNALFESQTGLKNAIGKTAYELVPNLESKWVELYGGVATTQKATRFVQGSQAMGRWFEVYAFPFGDESSHQVALLFNDISERKNAEQQIRESEERFRKLADDSPLFVFLIDPDKDATVSYWNKAWLEYTGQTMEEAVGTAWRGIIHNDDVPGVLDQYQPAMLEHKPYFLPATRVRRFDGTYRWHSFKGNPRYSSDGEFIGYVGVGIDIHEQKLNEEALKQSEKNLRNIILQAPVAMGILRGPEFVVEIANDKMYELWGRGKEELLNKSIFEGLPEVRDQGYEQLLTAVYTSGIPFSAYGIPVSLPREGRVETVYINLLYEAFREADGTVSGIMAVATDVTAQVLARQKIEEVVAERTQELHQANLALVRTNQELARSNENLEQFAYAASHDLKEPMRKIHMFTDRLQHHMGDKATKDELTILERITTAAERMRTLIDDLLMYSHFSAGMESKESVDLKQLVLLTLHDLDLDIEEKKASIIVGDLPLLKGNARQLQQLFQNLVGNALKYSKPGIPPRIEISSEVAEPAYSSNGEQEQVVIRVTDNGIGFDNSDRERIFNVFTRLHGSNVYKGTGIGLAIARKVAENHGGVITAEAKPDSGATFTIVLPVGET